ncbi:Olfactory receptor 4N2 [Tupaia chinensis]|uniref:Olfactory receptor 4N2 n=1 Tax=Tupaia chinensis TaxID=246437 RepID=L9KRM2_TUPCH|nr:Olfactory receptor 4N2 [Tupaia chinensis]
MEMENSTVVTEFILLGLTQSRGIQLLVFVLILIFYFIILPGNFLIIFTIRSDPGLTAPLYFFLGNLAFLDASYSFIVAPRMLVDFLSEKKVISYRGCITQLFFLHLLGGGEELLLVAMAFDRYIAICRPLHYSTVMNPKACYAMVLALWLGGFVHSITQVALILRLPFCGPNQLDNFFCDVPQVIKLACTDTFVVELLMVFNSGLLTLLCFLGLLASYAVILCRVHGSSSEGKKKAMSTCTTHIIVIFLMFGPAIFIYTRPFRTFPADKVVSFFHTVIFPLMNPMIYTLRNQEVSDMEYENSTEVKEFILLGLTQSRGIQLLVFVLILIFYFIILPGNFLIIFTIRSDPRLSVPLYFFLGNLAFLDASYSFIVAPRMLVDFLSEKKVISYRGCITQLFFLHFLGGGEGLLLVVMAFDRYIAICRPLHYSTVMNPRACYAMVLILWFGGFVHSIIQVALILRLPFCGPNQLDNFFCDVPQVIKLACTDVCGGASDCL